MPLDILGDHNETHDSIESFMYYSKPGEVNIRAINSRAGAPSLDIYISIGEKSPEISLRFFGVPVIVKLLEAFKSKGSKVTNIMLDNDSYRF